MFDFLFDFFGGTEHSTNEDITVLSIKHKAAKTLEDAAPLKDVTNFQSYDTDHNGWITGSDCPYQPGSDQAKLFWEHVVLPALKATKSLPDAIQYQQEYGNHFKGLYNGQPIITGPHSSIGNNMYIQDRLITVQGMSKASAVHVSDFISQTLIRTQ